MADSKDKKSDTSSDEFAEDLDAMLNDAESAMGDQDEMIDDEDAIDRLLMNDAFDVAEEEVADDDVDKLLETSASEDVKQETEEKQVEEADDFSADENVGSIMEEAVSTEVKEEKPAVDDTDGFDVDDLINSVASGSDIEDDEFAEIDEFAGDIIESESEPEPEPEPETKTETETETEDDFLMADFDISADEDDDEITVEPEDEADSTDIQSAQVEEQSNETETEVEAEAEAEPEPEPEPEPEAEAEPTQQDETVAVAAVSAGLSESVAGIEKNKAAIDEVKVQIKNLTAENESLKQQVTELAAPGDDDNEIAEDIESLQKEQRKLRKLIKENEDKVPVLIYVALGIAILALLIGGGLGAIGYGAQSDVTELTELVMTLEEEIEILTAQNNSKDIDSINRKITLLIAKDENFNAQVSELTSSAQSNPLKPVVDDLVVQNDHAQVAIEQLLAKVDSLEKRKFSSASSKKSKKAVAKVTWVVNLVSFKQEWYAKRKATEFKKKGVPAEVKQVKVKGENWFRLTVKGFKSKYEAAAYAVKVKKTLNLTSVWVTKA